jgi:hypothetical protein
MREFIKTISIFAVGLIFSLVGLYSFVDFCLNHKSARNSIFIWGDSQAYRGIDLQVLKKSTGKNIYTAAAEGQGVYNFLVFTEKIPNNSQVIVAESKLTQIRRKIIERSSSGISPRSLYKLYENNYSFSEIAAIIWKNRIPYKIFSQSTDLYPYSDSIVFLPNEPISFFEDHFRKVPPFIGDKQNILIYGLNRLKSKNCRVVFIQFPFHQILNKIEDCSPIKPKTEEFKDNVLSLFREYESDTLQLDNSINAMYDLTHLNELGAQKVSEFIGEKFNKYGQAAKGFTNEGVSVEIIVIDY